MSLYNEKRAKVIDTSARVLFVVTIIVFFCQALLNLPSLSFVLR